MSNYPDNFSGTNMDLPKGHDERRADEANNDLDTITNLKRDFSVFADQVRRMRVDGTIGETRAAVEDTLLAMEQSLDDLLHEAWHRNYELAGAVDRSASVPAISDLSAEEPMSTFDVMLAVDKRIRAAFAGPTNPATLVETGKLEA